MHEAIRGWLLRRVQRRQLLRGGSLAMLAWLQGGCAPQAPSPLPPTPRPRRQVDLPPSKPGVNRWMSEWSRHARIANAVGLGGRPEEPEMRYIIASLKEQHVTVAETDTVLSDWLTDEEFAEVMAAARHWNQLARAAGLRVVWYYPSLEILSPDAEDGPSFFKEHPDWAQISLKGEPNVFIGGAEAVKVVFWVDPGVESMWLSPNSPWRDYYLDRVREIARTGADGLWPDVPLYFDVVHLWCDTSNWARAAFKADTGLDIPTAVNWRDPVWRRWVEWRHRNLNRWCIDIAEAGRSVNPRFETFVETVTCDHMDATTMGLDGAYLRLVDGVTQAWEVDTVSDDYSMYYATEDDWICMIAIYKYCRAASGRKPAWTFTKGWKPEDAAQVMAEALVAGCNPYEVQVPGKTVGVDHEMRTRWYRFVKEHTARLFDTDSLARVALYHSTACRDYVAPSPLETPPSAVYASTKNPVGRGHWWSTRRADSRYEVQWLGEYTGMLKVLVNAHIPFNVLTSPTFQAEDLDSYKVLLLPNLEAISDHEAAIMRHFMEAGGTIVLTGPNPTGWNEYGDERPEYVFADLLGIRKGQRPPSSRHQRVGAGQIFYFADLPGLDYFRHMTPAAYDKLTQAIYAGAKPFVTTDADRRVHLEAYTLDGATILHLTNFIGVRGAEGFTVIPTTFTVWIDIPTDKDVKSVEIASPDAYSPELEPLEYRIEGNQASFDLTVRQYTLVVIRWK